MNLAAALIQYRKKHDVTLAWVGERIGMSRGGVHNIEASRSDPSFSAMVRLVKLLKMTPEQIGRAVLAHPASPAEPAKRKARRRG